MTVTRKRSSARMSQIVVHNGTVYLAGQVADDPDADIATQTQQVLGKVESLLTEAGTDKSRVLSAIIYLADMRHFAQMNEVWDAWVVQGETPARAAVEARLARPEFLVEVSVVAAAD